MKKGIFRRVFVIKTVRFSQFSARPIGTLCSRRPLTIAIQDNTIDQSTLHSIIYCQKPEIARTAQIGVMHSHGEALLSGIYVQQSCKFPNMVDTNLLLNNIN